MRILDADSMREVDRAAIEEMGIPSLVLMENAAIGLADTIAENLLEVTAVAIFCGPGNNGGDGLALARHLRIRGYHVEVSLITTGKGLSGDARVQLDICQNQGIAIREYGPDDSVRRAVESARSMDLVVDALFGIGLTRPLAGHFAELVEGLNRLPIPCLAVDLPSGLNGSSAEVIGPHVQAEMTVTFGAPKVPHVFLPAAEAVGGVVVADLGVPTELVDGAAGDLHLLTAEELAGWLKPRRLDSHKGDYGHAVIVAGSVGKAGAAILAARGAVRSGAGLVTVAAPAPIVQTIDLGSVESMTLPLSVGEDGGLLTENVEAILEFSAGKQVLTIGPGVGTSPTTFATVRDLVATAKCPVVLDADGLNALAGSFESLSGSQAPRILTPHPGELARLLGVTAAEIQEDRIASVRSAASKTGSVVVLKGYQSLIGNPEGRVFVNPTGNPGMATGGTGDVLTGMISGLLSQGYDALSACCLGVYLHGSAGDIAAAEHGQTGLAARDLLDSLPDAWDRFQE